MLKWNVPLKKKKKKIMDF